MANPELARPHSEGEPRIGTITPKPTDFDAQSVASNMGIGLCSVGEPDPSVYFKFAQLDLADGTDPRRLVNALSNAKRAMHLQVELLTDALGYTAWQAKSKGVFPVRIEFLGKCGLITPRIVSKINRLRNAVEHDYVMPDRDTVEDFVEVVGLYLDASDKFARNFPHTREMHLGPWQDQKLYCLRTKRGSGCLKLYESDNLSLIKALPGSDSAEDRTPPDAREPVGITPILEVRIRDDEPTYFEWAKVLLGTQ